VALSACEVTIDKTRKELVKHGLVMFPIACYEDDLALTAIPWHWHDEFELIIITEGLAPIQVEETTIQLMEGDAIFINSGVLHNIDNGKTMEAKYHSLVFHARLIGGSIDSIFWQKLITPIMQDKSFRYLHLDHSIYWQADLIKNMATAWQAVVEEIDDYENLVRYNLSKAFRLLNNNRQVADVKTSYRERLSVERTKVMIQYMEEHYSEELSLDIIADSAYVSKSVCLRCFRQVIGSTPIRYLVQYRIEKAAERLITTDDKANEIAISCGFSDISYFSKCFRELKGLSPLEYRKSFTKKCGSA
jgi:AraC-like DNA-binding protein